MIQDNKRLLREQYDQARGLAERVNGSRQQIAHLKSQIEQVRVESAVAVRIHFIAPFVDHVCLNKKPCQLCAVLSYWCTRHDTPQPSAMSLHMVRPVAPLTNAPPYGKHLLTTVLLLAWTVVAERRTGRRRRCWSD